MKYRAARAENFSIENETQKLNRVIEALTETLSKFNSAPPTASKLETALTCRAVATYLRKRLPRDADYWAICEQSSLAAILNSLSGAIQSEAQLFVRDLPNLLSLPYPAVKDIRDAARQILSQFMNDFSLRYLWREYVELDYLRDLLKLESDNFVER